MRTGIVKWFDAKKGFGFIIDDNTGMDIFVHFSAIASDGFKKLDDDQRVSYDIKDTEKGKMAVNVIRI